MLKTEQRFLPAIHHTHLVFMYRTRKPTRESYDTLRGTSNYVYSDSRKEIKYYEYNSAI